MYLYIYYIYIFMGRGGGRERTEGRDGRAADRDSPVRIEPHSEQVDLGWGRAGGVCNLRDRERWIFCEQTEDSLQKN